METRIPPNPVKARLATGEPAIGLGVHLARSGEIAYIAKATGHDFIWIDTQHGLFDLETIRHLALTALALGVAPVVRVRGVEDPSVAHLLDGGVTGIVFPDIVSPEDAKRAVASVKFAPTGSRSLGGAYPQFNYQRIPQSEAVPLLNETTVVVCMVETVAGLDNVEDIAAVEGVDVVHIGTSDMLNSMGKPGSHDDPEIVAAVDRVVAAALAHGKHAGCGGNRTIDAQRKWIRRGVRFLTSNTDLGLVSVGAREWIDALRAPIEPRP